MQKQKITLVLVAFLLSGCPPKMFGFYRMTNPEPTVVGFECVEDNVTAIPGIVNLTYGTEEGWRPLTWSGIKPATTVHRFEFAYQGEQLTFSFEQYWDGKISYHGGAATTEKEQAPKLIALTRPLFASIEAVIKSCGFENIDEVAFGASF